MSNEGEKMTWMDIVMESINRKDEGLTFAKIMFDRLPKAPQRADYATEEEFQKVLVQWDCYAERLDCYAERIIRQAKRVDEQMAAHDAAEKAKAPDG